MIVLTCSFAFVLAVQDAEPQDCPIGDNACNAALYERRAREAKSPKHRALHLHGAYLSYLSLYDRTGKAEHLCNARRAFDGSLAVKEQPASQRASFEAELPELQKREKRGGMQCEAKRRLPKKEAPRLAKAETVPPARTISPPEPAAEPSPASPTEPPSVSPAEPSPSPATPRAAVALLEPETAPPQLDPLLPVPRPRPVADIRPGRPLVIAGGVTLGVGLALAGVAGYAGGRALTAYREGVELHREVQGLPDDAARGRDAALEAEYRTMGALAIGTSIAGGSAVIVGAVLSVVGGRRLARAASRTALLPAPGGLAFHARF